MSIDIVKLNQNDIGRWVWYKPQFGPAERGRIKSWNEKNVFVVYKCDGQWRRFQDFTGEATEPSDLTFIEHKSHCRALTGFMCACVAPDINIVEVK